MNHEVAVEVYSSKMSSGIRSSNPMKFQSNRRLVGIVDRNISDRRGWTYSEVRRAEAIIVNVRDAHPPDRMSRVSSLGNAHLPFSSAVENKFMQVIGVSRYFGLSGRQCIDCVGVVIGEVQEVLRNEVPLAKGRLTTEHQLRRRLERAMTSVNVTDTVVRGKVDEASTIRISGTVNGIEVGSA